eukprot:4659127-Amphidinium_carterae.1
MPFVLLVLIVMLQLVRSNESFFQRSLGFTQLLAVTRARLRSTSSPLHCSEFARASTCECLHRLSKRHARLQEKTTTTTTTIRSHFGSRLYPGSLVKRLTGGYCGNQSWPFGHTASCTSTRPSCWFSTVSSSLRAILSTSPRPKGNAPAGDFDFKALQLAPRAHQTLRLVADSTSCSTTSTASTSTLTKRYPCCLGTFSGGPVITEELDRAALRRSLSFASH